MDDNQERIVQMSYAKMRLANDAQKLTNQMIVGVQQLMLKDMSARHEVTTKVDELADYAVYHFKTKETIWHEHLSNDPLESEHQKYHKDFTPSVIRPKAEITALQQTPCS